jgi:seryl-tRNA synthetase
VRVDAICDKILAELRASPEAVKDIFIKPDETIAALRATCRNLTRRERDLRKFLSPQDDERLMREREALQKRIEGESDEVTKMRLASALAALDAQRDQRVELARAAARFDAEHTRISYTLESLYTQVVRMRSADSSSVDVSGAGLRRSLDMLSREANALADALEKVNSGEAERMRKAAVGPSADSSGTPPAGPGTREKA